MTPRIGVLSLQGDFERHARSIEALGLESVRVTLPEQLDRLAALILPGGESSTMLRLLDATGLREPLESFVRSKPVLGTCAGTILLAKQADRLPRPTLGVLDVTVERNGFGRQLHSFTAPVDVPVAGGEVLGVFIRAPRILNVGDGVEVLARHRHEGSAAPEPVAVRSGSVVGLTFHPELTSDLRLHRWFLGTVAGLAMPAAAIAPSRSSEAA